MPISITVNLTDTSADLLAGYGAGAKVGIQRDTTAGFAAPTNLTGIPIISGTERYETWDASGTASSWYRTRYENTAGTLVSDWETGWQPGTTVYAEIEDLRERLRLPDDSNDNLLEDLLRFATDYITNKTQRSFFRVPASGTTTRTYDLPRAVSSIWDDFVTVTLVEIASYSGGSLTALAATDWYLVENVPRLGWPYSRLVLSDRGVYRAFYPGYQVVRVTGAFGWPAIPERVKEATLSLAEERYWQSRGGRQVGLDFGRIPPLVAELEKDYGPGPLVG